MWQSAFDHGTAALIYTQNILFSDELILTRKHFGYGCPGDIKNPVPQLVAARGAKLLDCVGVPLLLFGIPNPMAGAGVRIRVCHVH